MTFILSITCEFRKKNMLSTFCPKVIPEIHITQQQYRILFFKKEEIVDYWVLGRREFC